MSKKFLVISEKFLVDLILLLKIIPNQEKKIAYIPYYYYDQFFGIVNEINLYFYIKFNKLRNNNKKIMISYSDFPFIEEKLCSGDYSHMSAELLPLDENADSIKNIEKDISNKAKKSSKFIMTKKGEKGFKERRKFKEDNFRKKIKTSHLKYEKHHLDDNLIKAGSKKTFENFPQFFVADITRKTNNYVMNLTYGELFEYIQDKLLSYPNESNKIKNVDKEKYIRNKETLEYLASHPEISERSGWDKIKNTKYIDLLRAFLKSKEFEESVISLSKKESEDYIRLYRYFAETYVDYFLSYNPNTTIEVTERNSSSDNETPNLASGNIMDINDIHNMPNIIQFPSFLMSEEIDIVGNMLSDSNYDSIENNSLELEEYIRLNNDM